MWLEIDCDLVLNLTTEGLEEALETCALGIDITCLDHDLRCW